jgi:hypothetical protein
MRTFDAINAAVGLMTLALSSYALYRTYQADDERMLITPPEVMREENVRFRDYVAEGSEENKQISKYGFYNGGTTGPGQAITGIPFKLFVGNLSDKPVSIISIRIHNHTNDQEARFAEEFLEPSASKPELPINIAAHTSEAIIVHLNDFLSVPPNVAKACRHLVGSINYITSCIMTEYKNRRWKNGNAVSQLVSIRPIRLELISQSGAHYFVDLPEQ